MNIQSYMLKFENYFFENPSNLFVFAINMNILSGVLFRIYSGFSFKKIENDELPEYLKEDSLVQENNITFYDLTGSGYTYGFSMFLFAGKIVLFNNLEFLSKRCKFEIYKSIYTVTSQNMYLIFQTVVFSIINLYQRFDTQKLTYQERYPITRVLLGGTILGISNIFRFYIEYNASNKALKRLTDEEFLEYVERNQQNYKYSNSVLRTISLVFSPCEIADRLSVLERYLTIKNN